MGRGRTSCTAALVLGALLVTVAWVGSASTNSVPAAIGGYAPRLAHAVSPSAAALPRTPAGIPAQMPDLSSMPSSGKQDTSVLPGQPPSADPSPGLAVISTQTPTPSTSPAPVPTPSPATTTAACAAVGLFVRSESPSVAASLGSELGVDGKVLTVYAYNKGAGPYTAFTFAPDAGVQLLLGVGAVTPAEATAIGDHLMAEGYANTIIRIMWEMNGNWEPWGTQALSAAKYISIYRAAEQAFAAVPGNHFTYVWNVAAGTVEPGRTEFDTYPGNAYVTNVGIDLYDEWGQYKNVPAIISFAQSQGKPVSFDEWGLDGTDDASFINYVSSLVHDPADDVTLQAYFSSGLADLSLFPEAEAAYKTDFSGPC